jgi:hypothetical protein
MCCVSSGCRVVGVGEVGLGGCCWLRTNLAGVAVGWYVL